jgi:myo-inositol-1(or 4)-monophosphatase
MNFSEKKRALNCAVEAARAAGRMMTKNLLLPKKINGQSRHDIKLDLDVRCQKLIEKILHKKFSKFAFLGEEGCGANIDAEFRWVVDPIDGTVNFTYEIPHSCVSIALQRKVQDSKSKVQSYKTIIGVVYDPFCDELWTAIHGQPARLNGKIIHVSKRNKLSMAIVSIGFGKTKESIEATLPYLNELLRRVRKLRMMGAAALAMVYVASGRFDGYVEQQGRLWDIAAGGLILECAGGEFWHRQVEGEHAYQILANNGLLRRQLEKLR